MPHQTSEVSVVTIEHVSFTLCCKLPPVQTKTFSHKDSPWWNIHKDNSSSGDTVVSKFPSKSYCLFSFYASWQPKRLQKIYKPTFQVQVRHQTHVLFFPLCLSEFYLLYFLINKDLFITEWTWRSECRYWRWAQYTKTIFCSEPSNYVKVVFNLDLGLDIFTYYFILLISTLIIPLWTQV